MSSLEKLIQKILAGKNISFTEAEKILLTLGFSVDVSGSHHVFRKPKIIYNVSLKGRSQLLSYQVKLLQKVLLDHGYKKKQ